MKKIFVDGLGLVEGHFSGVGQYILGILRGMDKLIDEQKYAGKASQEVFVIIPRDMVYKFRAFRFKHIACKSIPIPFRIMSKMWYDGSRVPIDLICGKGVYIFPRFVGMNLAFSQSLLVVYDLSFELYRQYAHEQNAIFLSQGVRRSIAKSEKIITISKNAKKELVDFYNLDPQRVLVATPATDPALFYRRCDAEIERVKQKYGIKSDYILALSNLEPRKNLEALVTAYCQLPKHITDKVALLLVGVNGWKSDALFETIIRYVEQGYNIVRPSEYVADEDKPAIISGAKLLAYPSHYEGFGMPPLEALACGTPVITSDNSSLPEVVGSTSSMVASSDIDGLRGLLEEHLSNTESKSKELVRAGPEQAQRFSWTESAQIFLDAAKELGA